MDEPDLHLPQQDGAGGAPGSGNAPSRRLRLREFQTQLIERMRAARSSTAQSTSQLGILAGRQRWLLSLQQAGEVAVPGRITPAPLTQDWFLGLMNLRGNLISVSDFAAFMGLAPTTIDKSSRIVAFAPALELHGALLVSQVFGLRDVAKMKPTEGAPAPAPWIGKRYIDQEEQAWTELRLSELARDPRFLTVER